MSRTLVTQLVEALEKLSDTEQTYAALDKADAAIKAAREYLATEPSGERRTMIAVLRGFGIEILGKAADMLEADAQPKSFIRERAQLEQEWGELRKLKQAQQTKRVPLSDDQIEELAEGIAWDDYAHDLARRVEKHHGITPADKPADDESEDLYALALKADNWGQP